MFFYALFVFFRLFLMPCGVPVASAASLTPFMHIDSFLYSEPVSIKAVLFDHWKGKYSRGRRQCAWGWFEAGLLFNNTHNHNSNTLLSGPEGDKKLHNSDPAGSMIFKKIGLSFVKRYEYDLRFSESTAEVYGLVKNKKDLPPGRQFGVDLKAAIFHAQGIRISLNNSFFNNKLQLTTGLSYLESDYYIDGNLTGKVTAVGKKDYDYNARVNYYYTDDILFDRPLGGTKGRGFTLDVKAEMELLSNWRTSFKITDLVSRIYWDDLPFTNAVATSDRKKYDSKGYVHIDPLLSGTESNKHRVTYELSPRYQFKTNYFFKKYASFFEGFYQYDFFLWNIGGSVFTCNGQALMKYWPVNRAVTIGYRNKKCSFELTSDHYDFNKIKMFKLNFIVFY